jgi:hypothetical protein
MASLSYTGLGADLNPTLSNGQDFRLIRRHKEFALRVLPAEAASLP